MTEESNTQVKQTEHALQDAYAQITELSDQLASLQEDRPHKVPRQLESLCTPISTHTDLPINGECNTTHPVSAPPLLLSQMQPIDPTDILANAQALAPNLTTATPKIRFPALLPIIYYCADNSLHTSNPSVYLTPDRDINFCRYKHYIFATGDTSLDGAPGFCTTLVWCEHFLTPEAITTCRINDKLPLIDLVLGGRNGVVISSEKNPHTQIEVDTLLNAPDKIGYTQAYIEHI